MDEIFYYDGEFTGEEIDEAVGAALNPDSTPDSTHTSNLITSAAVAGVQGSIASISITGTTNNTGATIASGTYFYLSGALVVATTAIANGATLTSGTNYEAVTAGGLNAVDAKYAPIALGSHATLASLESAMITAMLNRPDGAIVSGVVSSTSSFGKFIYSGGYSFSAINRVKTASAATVNFVVTVYNQLGVYFIGFCANGTFTWKSISMTN